jgi:hypothetical protein
MPPAFAATSVRSCAAHCAAARAEGEARRTAPPSTSEATGAEGELRVGVGGRCNQTGARLRKGTTRYGSPLFGSSLTLRRARLVTWLCARVYVACTTTDFVWISSARLDGKLIQPHRLCATRCGAMHSPSGSLLTPRVSGWTHWRSVDRHVPCSAVVAFDLKVSSYRGFT